MAVNLLKDRQGVSESRLLLTNLLEESHLCPVCGSRNTRATYVNDRVITILLTGSKKPL